MKAIRYHKFGDPKVLQIEEVDKLTIDDDQMLVEVYSTTVNSGDCHLRSGRPFLARMFAGPIVPRHRILGTTYSGKVIEIGANIKNFKLGDEVMGSLGINSGTYSECIAIKEDSIVIKKPLSLTHEECASIIFGSLSAKHFLDKAYIAKGKSVLIIGASGGVGSYSVQYAKSMGAHVIGICHTESIDFVRKIGADKILDYTVDKLENCNMKFDIIFDTVGKEDLHFIKSSLKTEGIYITTVARFDIIIRGILNKSARKKLVFDVAKSKASSLISIMEMLSSGLYLPLIDSVYKMDDVVKAHSHFESARKKGAVVLNIKN